MSDLIRRSDAIKALHEEWNGGWLEATGEWVADNCEAVLNRLSPAEITADDVLEYCRPRLPTIVAEEAVPSADRPQGEWIDAEIPLESGGSMPIQVCNLCKTFYPLAYTGGGHRFCPNCGAKMKGADDE